MTTITKRPFLNTTVLNDLVRDALSAERSRCYAEKVPYGDYYRSLQEVRSQLLDFRSYQSKQFRSAFKKAERMAADELEGASDSRIYSRVKELVPALSDVETIDEFNARKPSSLFEASLSSVEYGGDSFTVEWSSDCDRGSFYDIWHKHIHIVSCFVPTGEEREPFIVSMIADAMNRLRLQVRKPDGELLLSLSEDYCSSSISKAVDVVQADILYDAESPEEEALYRSSYVHALDPLGREFGCYPFPSA